MSVTRVGIAALIALTLARAAPARAGDACAEARALADGDLLAAAIVAPDCADAEVAREVARRASDAGWSPVEVVTEPAGGTVVVDAAAARPFTAPRTIWLPPGRYELTAIVDGAPVAATWVRVKDGDRALVRLVLPAPPAPAGDGAVDFEEEGGGEVASGPPPKVELPSLLPERYRRGVEARGPLDGPPARPRPPAWRLAAGAVVGFVDGDATGPGAIVALSRAWRARVIPPLRIVPAVGAVAMPDVGGDTAAQLVGEVAVLVDAVRGRDLRVRAGGGAAVTRTWGADAVDGVALGVVASAELAWPRLSVGARAELPAWRSADADVVTVAALLGLRW